MESSSTPAKPQSLHNFELPSLKWNTDGNSSSSSNRRRRSFKSPSRRPNLLSPSHIRQSSSLDSVSAPQQRHPSPIRREPPNPSLHQFWSGHSSPETEAPRKDEVNPILYCRNYFKNSVSAGSIRICSSGTEAKDKIEEKLKAREEGDGIKRSKILIKIPIMNKEGEKNPPKEPTKIVVDNNGEHGGWTDETVKRVDEKTKVWNLRKNPTNEPKKIIVDNNGENNGEHGGLTDETVNSVDEETKVWNLRPRKPNRKPKNAIVDTGKTEKAQPPLKKTDKSGEKEGEKEKKEKKKLSICISLSKEEIDEDIYALTGSKPSRRPKKRAKNVQKKMDSVFPGLWLVSISPDSYKVSENSMKG